MADFYLRGASAPGALTPANEEGSDARSVGAPERKKNRCHKTQQVGIGRKCLAELALLRVAAVITWWVGVAR